LIAITASAQRILAEHPDYPFNFIEEHVIEWLLSEFAPPTYTPEQFDELDRLTQTWVEDHKRQAKAPGKGQELATLELIVMGYRQLGFTDKELAPIREQTINVLQQHKHRRSASIAAALRRAVDPAKPSGPGDSRRNRKHRKQ
jgi:hypothetical protein